MSASLDTVIYLHRLSIDTENPDGSTNDFTYASNGAVLSHDITNPDGSTDNSAYTYNADGSYTQAEVVTPAGGGVPTNEVLGFNSQGQQTSLDVTNADGSTDDTTFVYNTDGTRTLTEVATPAGGQATTTVMVVNSQGQAISTDVTYPDGSTHDYTYAPNGELFEQDITNPDGSTDDSTYAYNADGSRIQTEVMTAAAGGSSTTRVYEVNAQGQQTSLDITNADGSTDESSYAYNADGSYTQTELVTPANGGLPTTTVTEVNSMSQPIIADTTYPDGSTDNLAYTYNEDGSYTRTEVQTPAGPGGATTSVAVINGQGQWLSLDITNPDGSTDNTVYTYNPDGSSGSTEVVRPAGGGQPTTTVADYNSEGQSISVDITNPDGSTDDSTFAYNSDGSYTDTEVVTPTSGSNWTTAIYDYNADGQLVGVSYQASGANQEVAGESTGPDTIAGGYQGDVLIGNSGDDTFEYGLGGGSESVSETVSASSTSKNTLQFGTGVAPASLTVSVSGDPELVLSIGSGADSVSIEGFNPLNPLQSFPIQSFAFAGGANLSLLQLLADSDVSGSSGSITNADGSVTSCEFTPSGQQIYFAEARNSEGQKTETVVLNADGSEEVDSFNAQGQMTSADYANADGSTDNNTYVYAAGGSISNSTEVQTPAGGGGSTTTVREYDTSGNMVTRVITNPDGSVESDSFNAQGQMTNVDYTNTDGSTDDNTYVYGADGSVSSSTEIQTPVGGGGSTTTVRGYDASGNMVTRQITNPDGSVESATFNVQGQITVRDVTYADGSTDDYTYTYGTGSYLSSSTEVQTPAGGGGSTTTDREYDASGNMVTRQITYPDGSEESATFNAQGQITVRDVTNADGSTNDYTYTLNADGTLASTTQVSTPAGGGGSTTTIFTYDGSGNEVSQQETYPDGSGEFQTYNAQGQRTGVNYTDADGSTNDYTYTFYANGTLATTTEVSTPAGGGGSTTTIDTYDGSGNEVSEQVTNPDGSGELDTYNAQGQRIGVNYTHADGSANDYTYTYNANGTLAGAAEVSTPAGGGDSTTSVYGYDGNGNQVSENDYTPSADGSYTDVWTKADGSHGSYWWNASTLEYKETWYNNDGSNWTDDYQYSSGGSPGTTGYSYVETYSGSDGSEGTRQFDASTGSVSLTWDSAATGSLSGSTANVAFIGLQNDGELTNTQQDLTFFNPNVSPGFNAFLAGH
jgi:hypothetical protein